MECACGNVAVWAHCSGAGGFRGILCVTRRKRRQKIDFVRCSLGCVLLEQMPLAAVQLVSVGANTIKTVAPSVSVHAVALLTFAQVALTAALAGGACILPRASSDPRQGKTDDGTNLMFDGVDVTDYPIFREAKVQKAIDYARQAHDGQMRLSGEPYITHCIHTAKILAALVPQQGSKAIDTVVAGILHDIVDDTSRSIDDLRANFDGDVADLVAGVSRLSYINQLLRRHRRKTANELDMNSNGLSSAEVDNLRIMLLGMVDDPRVVLVKLADRLHNMRTIYALPSAKARAVAQETLAVWCSLASRLGLWAVKAELEDLCFAVLQPKTFREIRSGLAAMWSLDDESFKCSQKMREKKTRRALIYEKRIRKNNKDAEEVSMKDLLDAVIPFDLLSNRQRRKLGSQFALSRSKVVQDAEIALAALDRCEAALDKEIAISMAYIPGTEVRLSARLKSLYSTHAKMKRKGVRLNQIYDARALRVVVGDGGGKLHVAAVKECYSLLNIVHSLWMPIAGEFDDYIVNPKRSGYQSLHTAVEGPDGSPLEVQIRTQEMHEQAECGNAAHWLYKESGRSMIAQAMARTGPDVGDGNVDVTEAGGKVYPGCPALRIEGGRLRPAVVIRVDSDGMELLVAVNSGEAVLSRTSSDKERWKIFAYMYSKVSKSWWFAPGHGSSDTYLEKYVLCTDNIYHKHDQYRRPLPTFLQLLDLDEQEKKDYMQLISSVGDKIESPGGCLPEGVTLTDNEDGSAATRLNNKVKLLRSMLQWEEVQKETAPNHEPGLAEVLVIWWPDGGILRMPAGSTIADAAQQLGIHNNLVCLNGQVVPPLVKLKDGDVIEVSAKL